MTCTRWVGGKEGAIKASGSPSSPPKTAEQMKNGNCCPSPWDGRPSSQTWRWCRTKAGNQEHLLGPNWSLQQLMASCGCMFTSHLFCMLRFPSPPARSSHFKITIPTTPCLPLSVCLPPSLLFSHGIQEMLGSLQVRRSDSYLKSHPLNGRKPSSLFSWKCASTICHQSHPWYQFFLSMNIMKV